MQPEFSAATRQEDGGVWVVRVGGEIDMATAPKLDAVLDEIVASKPSRVLLEFQDVSFVDSTGIRVLVAASRRLEADGAKLRIDGLSGAVEKVFEIAGLLDSLAERRATD